MQEITSQCSEMLKGIVLNLISYLGKYSGHTFGYLRHEIDRYKLQLNLMLRLRGHWRFWSPGCFHTPLQRTFIGIIILLVRPSKCSPCLSISCYRLGRNFIWALLVSLSWHQMMFVLSCHAWLFWGQKISYSENLILSVNFWLDDWDGALHMHCLY